MNHIQGRPAFTNRKGNDKLIYTFHNRPFLPQCATKSIKGLLCMLCICFLLLLLFWKNLPQHLVCFQVFRSPFSKGPLHVYMVCIVQSYHFIWPTHCHKGGRVGEGTPPILSTKVLAADADYLPPITEAGAGVGARPKIAQNFTQFLSLFFSQIRALFYSPVSHIGVIKIVNLGHYFRLADKQLIGHFSAFVLCHIFISCLEIFKGFQITVL